MHLGDKMNNTELMNDARTIFPGGVNSPVRSFSSVGGQPFFTSHAKGPFIYDVEGTQYIDFIGSWGPMILGHADDDVVRACKDQLDKGLSYGTSCALEVELGQLVKTFFPVAERFRFVNSGTEATMSAIRLAKGATGRDHILKFEGHYHGHVDALLVKAGSGLLTQGTPTSLGVSEHIAQQTHCAKFNDLASVDEILQQFGDQIAAIIIEPIAGNMNLVSPQAGFLQGLRDKADQYGCLLIFDEVMSGFRVSRGGATERLGVVPDLITLGKIIGGGLPCAAYGGREDIMQFVSPDGGVYQAGTLSGNPLAMASGLATLRKLATVDYDLLASNANNLLAHIQKEFEHLSIPFSYDVIGGMFGFVFNEQYPTSFSEVQAADQDLFKAFFHQALQAGVYFAPSMFEAGFISITHDANVIDMAKERVSLAIEKMKVPVYG